MKIVKIPFSNLVSLLSIASLVFMTTVSLVTYNYQDPSLNRATNSFPKNSLGFFGANIADLLYQTIGLAAFFLPMILTFWLINLFIYRKIEFLKLRVLVLTFFIISVSGFLASFEVGEYWLHTSYGGFIGLYFDNLVTFYLREDKMFFYLITNIFLFIASSSITRDQLNILFNLVSDLFFYTLEVLYKIFVTIFIYTKLLMFKYLFKSKYEQQLEAINIEKKKTKASKKSSNSIRKNNRLKTSMSKNSENIADNEYTMPSLSFLSNVDKPSNSSPLETNLLRKRTEELMNVLNDFGVKGEINTVHTGPVVTLFELEPEAGTKSARVIGLADDIARVMQAESARLSVISGRNAIGIELPNKKREIVLLKEIFESEEFINGEFELPIVLGKDIEGNPIIVDLTKMPHLLIAGTTGSGKSVGINTMILSLLYTKTSDECKMIMIDPKVLELSTYDGIPHLLSPVVTEPSKAVASLKWIVKEMENRYRLMSFLSVRNIRGFNERIERAIANSEVLEKTVQTGYDPETGRPKIETEPLELKKLPYIVVIVDEMADLMLVAGKEIETSVQRLAQMARAAGIHIIMATQRPSVDVITGVIKANFPTRISFQVTSRIDSRTILGEQGAEQLLGMGDMLYLSGGGKVTRVHGPFVSDSEVEKIVNFLKSQKDPEYIDQITLENEDDDNSVDSISVDNLSGDDELYKKAVEIVISDKKVSTSYVQRKLRIGYNRAASMIERMEQEGIISEPMHNGRREILVK